MKITSRIRAHRDDARARLEWQRALQGAPTPSHREELLALSRHAGSATYVR